MTTTGNSGNVLVVTERDRTIGQNLAAYRGGRSQQWVADEMRERGHKWSQSTVWSIEKGERPVRLTEAEDLAKVLQLRDPLDLLVSKPAVSVRDARRAFGMAVVQAIPHLKEAIAVGQQLRSLLSDPAFDPSEVDPIVLKDAREYAEVDVLDYMRAVLDRSATAADGTRRHG